MPFKPGMPKVPGSGRKRGVKNKNNLTVHEKLEKAGFEFHVELVNALKDPLLSPEVRAKVVAGLTPYFMPRLKEADTAAPEIPTEDDEDVPEDTEALLALVTGNPSIA